MTKLVTIELPDDLAQQLEVAGNDVEGALQKIVLNTLNTLAELMRSLHSDNPAIRAHAAKKLGEMGAETAVIKLAEAISDPDPLVQRSAETALRNIGTIEAITVLSKQEPTPIEIPSPDPDYEPLLALAGTLEIGTTSLGENHDDYIAEVLEAELCPGE